jgi:hypothetical protein
MLIVYVSVSEQFPPPKEEPKQQFFISRGIPVYENIYRSQKL